MEVNTCIIKDLDKNEIPKDCFKMKPPVSNELKLIHFCDHHLHNLLHLESHLNSTESMLFYVHISSSHTRASQAVL